MDRLEGEQQGVDQALSEKAIERERIMMLFRRGHATPHDVEAQLEAIEQETPAHIFHNGITPLSRGDTLPWNSQGPWSS